MVQNSDQRGLSGNKENTPLMKISNWTDLNINHSRKDEIRNNETIEDEDFPALRSNYDRETHARQNYFNLKSFAED